jgi:hypothetical protein
VREMREDTHYEDATYASSGEYEEQVRHCQKQDREGFHMTHCD